MHKRSLSFLLIAVLCGIGISSARAEPSPSRPPPHHDDVQGTVSAGKGRLGIIALQISPELRASLGAPHDRGVLVDAVRPDSPAAHAGLQVGDIVTDVDGDATRSASDVLGAMADRHKGDEVAVVAVRRGQRVELRAKLDSDPGPVGPSNGFRGVPGMPDDMNGWFRFDGSPDDMHSAIEELRKRMDELEHRLGKQHPQVPGGTEHI
ncbi:MAG TPA: PDZ domain-containing protein [Kofleriaceae bacterium]|jgi:membrane-associated protease RseP (regulator of RpoE activity)|nr:PDZ domain-containing protein [Kofleriaceae bacterium]